MKYPRPLILAGAFAAAALFSAPLVRAQHGPGPEMKPLPVAEKAATVSFAEGVKEDAALAALFREFAEGLRTHDGKPFVPRLADNYVIPGYETDDMKAGFVKALTMIPSPQAITITAIESHGEGKLVKATLQFTKRSNKREFTFNAKNQLVMTTMIAMTPPETSAAPAH